MLQKILRAPSQKALNITVLLLALLCILATSLFQIFSPDLYWHLKMGEDLLTKGLSPFVDHYSFTARGESIHMVAWPFQVITSLFYQAFGGTFGLVIYRFLVWSLALAFLWKLVGTQLNQPLVRYLGIGFFLFAVVYRSEPRPEVASLALELLLMICLFAWRKDHSLKWTVAISGLFLFWSNWHVSSILGYIIAAGFVFGEAIKAVREKKLAHLKTLLLAGLAWNLVGFLNHDLSHSLIQQSGLDARWASYIIEYETRSFQQFEPTLQIFWVLIFASIPVLLLRRNWTGLFILVNMAWNSWSMSKLYPHLIVILTPFVCEAFESVYEKVILSKTKFLVSATTAILITLNLTVFGFQFYDSVVEPIHPRTGEADPNYFDFDTVNYIRSQQFKGQVFNDYSLGGFLLYSLAPHIEIYIDGRTNILFPISLMDRFSQASIDAETFKKEVGRYEIDFALGRLGTNENIVHTALESKLFTLDFVSRNGAFLREDGRFPRSSELWSQPGCLNSERLDNLKVEIQSAKSLLPSDSLLLSYYELVLNGAIESQLKTSFHSRMAAELAYRSGNGSLAISHLQKIQYPTGPDMVFMAEIDCEFNRCQNAEEFLNQTSRAGLSDFHAARALQALLKVSTTQGLKVFTDERVGRLKSRVGGLTIMPGSRCDESQLLNR